MVKAHFARQFHGNFELQWQHWEQVLLPQRAKKQIVQHLEWCLEELQLPNQVGEHVHFDVQLGMDNVVAAVVDNHNFDNHNLDFDLRSGKKETHIIYHVIKLCLKKLYQFLIHTYNIMA